LLMVIGRLAALRRNTPHHLTRLRASDRKMRMTTY
jgi:hypothetical protein